MSDWDDKADDQAVAHHTYEHMPPSVNAKIYMGFVLGARWQREQMRTDEAVERVARAVFKAEYAGAWDAAAEWMREECRLVARVTNNALLGDSA